MEKITEEQQRELDAAWADVTKAYEAAIKYNERLLNTIRKFKGEKFYNKLIKLFEDCEVGGGFVPMPLVITHKVSGNFQREIIPHWVDQYVNGGMEGDSYEGYIYVKLKKDRYLQAHYSM